MDISTSLQIFWMSWCYASNWFTKCRHKSGILLFLSCRLISLTLVDAGSENLTSVKSHNLQIDCSVKPCLVTFLATKNAAEQMLSAAQVLFLKYSTDNDTIDADGIKHLLNKINFQVSTGHDSHAHHGDEPFDDEPHIQDHGDDDHPDNSSDHHEIQCSALELLHSHFMELNSEAILNFDQFFTLLPALLLRAQSSSCKELNSPSITTTEAIRVDNIGVVWGIALVSVGTISLLSIIGIMIVPMMKHTVMFHRLLSYLIALAVGTLVGDALLHLLPHSLGAVAVGHDHMDEKGHTDEDAASEKDMILKNLVAILGIYLFFIFESVMGIMKQAKHNCKLNIESTVKSRCGGRGDEKHVAEETPESTVGMLIPTLKNEVGPLLPVSGEDCDVCEETVFYQASNAACVCNRENGIHPCNEQDGKLTVSDTVTTSPTQSNSEIHHHHDHGLKSTKRILDAAWMVIVGDGLHNFTDGLAIGAAFSSTISAGLSTSVAVFCHELPHELGDFAVLIKAGMSIKQALLYNALSAAFAFIGVILGMVVGEYMSQIKLWILTATAGGFLYVALVDMIPQLLASTIQGDAKMRFICQNLGFVSGVTSMFLIAWFEENFRNIFM